MNRYRVWMVQFNHIINCDKQPQYNQSVCTGRKVLFIGNEDILLLLLRTIVANLTDKKKKKKKKRN